MGRKPGDAERYLYGVNPVLEALRARPESIERLWVADGALTQRVQGELQSRARDAGLRVERDDIAQVF